MTPKLSGLRQSFYSAYDFVGQELAKGPARWLVYDPQGSWGWRFCFQDGSSPWPLSPHMVALSLVWNFNSQVYL